MQVSQRALAYMLLWALVCGVGLGVFYDCLVVLRRHTEPTSPFLLKLRGKLSLPPALRFGKSRGSLKQRSKKMEWPQNLWLFFQDVLFCLSFAVVAQLLLYAANDGQWRTSVIVLMLLACLVYRATLGRPVRRLLLLLRTVALLLLTWAVAVLIYPARWIWHLSEKPRRRVREKANRLRIQCAALVQKQKQKRAARRQSRREPQEKVASPTPAPRKPPDGKRVYVAGRRHTVN